MEKLLVEDLSKKTHRLCLSGDLFIFNSATSDIKRSESTVVYSKLLFERENNAFLKAADGAAVISGGISSRVDIIKCKCAVHVGKRVTTPCILVSKKGEDGESFHYTLLILTSSNRLEPCIEFKLSYQLKENVYILRGPTVLWSHAGNVFYKSLQTGEVRQIPLQLSHPLVGEFPLLKEQAFVLGLRNLSNSQSTNHTLGCLVENGLVFDGSMILPHPYICITRCILVLSAEKEDGDGVLRSSVVAATSCRQLVYFENGIVKDTCQLPFEQPENIQIVHTGRNGYLFAVSFHQGHVCALWKETFQVCNKNSVASVECFSNFIRLFFFFQAFFMKLSSSDSLSLVWCQLRPRGWLLGMWIRTDAVGF